MTRRLETGVFKPDGDWPGVFIRGKTALMTFNAILKHAQKLLSEFAGEDGKSCAYAIEEIISLFESCHMDKAKIELGVPFSGSQPPSDKVLPVAPVVVSVTPVAKPELMESAVEHDKPRRGRPPKLKEDASTEKTETNSIASE